MQPADIWTRTLFPSFTDYVIMAMYLMDMFIWAFHIQRQKRDTHPAYHYYAWGLFAKVGGGAIALCMIYTLYYKEGGDTTNFLSSSLLHSISCFRYLQYCCWLPWKIQPSF